MSSNEKDQILNAHEASDAEMAAVTGGVHIDWPASCKSTVEDGSGCIGSDACYSINNRYYRDKAKYGCSATVTSVSICNTNDGCMMIQIKYDTCTRDWAESDDDDEIYE